jgi:flagellar biosynthesis/type III secretory pathway protein FliH
LEVVKKNEDLDPAAVLAVVEKKLAEESHFAVN